MRYRNFLIMVCFGVFVSTAARATDATEYFPYPIEKVYLPSGLTDSDEVKIAVFGRFVNTLYHTGTFAVDVDKESNTIVVEQTAYADDGSGLAKLTPFSQVLTVGRVPEGNFSVIDKTSGRTLGVLAVVKGAEEKRMFAKVLDANIRSTPFGEYELVLEIEMTDRCSGIRNVVVEEGKEVIVVTPYLEIYSGSEFRCGPIQSVGDSVGFPVVYKLKNRPQGMVLLYVRSSDRAVAKIVNVDGE